MRHFMLLLVFIISNFEISTSQPTVQSPSEKCNVLSLEYVKSLKKVAVDLLQVSDSYLKISTVQRFVSFESIEYL